MSKLEELIAELCPGGVEYKTLGETTKILRGKRLTKNQLSNDERYPVFHGGLEPLGYYSESNRNANTVMIINVGASAGIVGYSTVDFWSSDGCFCIENSTLIMDRYAYYALLCCENLLRSKVRFAGIPTLDTKVVEDIKIPLPPLEVQREIVRILDNFTQLTAELTAELTARKKQYEYYRDRLLTFWENSINWMTFNECCVMSRGDYITKNTAKTGKIPVILGGQEPAYYIDTSNHSGKAIVISRSGASAGFVSYWNEPIFVTDGFIIEPKDVLNFRFLYFYFKNLQPTLNAMKKGGGVPHITGEHITKIKFPVPSLAEQQRIVDILDRFDTLCNDITKGLPAEIEARRKQYEYYRDKLLTFKEVGSD